MDAAIVPNEAQCLEFIHEKIDPGADCPDHFRQSFLRTFGKHFLRLVLLSHCEQWRGAYTCFPVQVIPLRIDLYGSTQSEPKQGFCFV
jgi:hypothetical protein